MEIVLQVGDVLVFRGDMAPQARLVLQRRYEIDPWRCSKLIKGAFECRKSYIPCKPYLAEVEQ